jgi:hypothetical protein
VDIPKAPLPLPEPERERKTSRNYQEGEDKYREDTINTYKKCSEWGVEEYKP